MADTSNLSNFLTDIADAIRTKKEITETIPAEQFDQEILSIETGVDTSDATATVNDILNPKTAYVNGEQIKGDIDTTFEKMFDPRIITNTTGYEFMDLRIDYYLALLVNSSKTELKVCNYDGLSIGKEVCTIQVSNINHACLGNNGKEVVICSSSSGTITLQIYDIKTKSFIFNKTYSKGYVSFGMIAENPIHTGVYGFVGYCQEATGSMYCYMYSCNDILQSNNNDVNILSSIAWQKVDMGVQLAQSNDRKINTGWCRWGADGTLLCCEIGATTWDNFWKYAPCSYYISEELEPVTHKVYASGKYNYSYMPTSEPYWYIESGKMAKNIKTNASFFLVGESSSSSDASTQTAAGGYYPGGIIIQPKYNSSAGSGKTNEILKYTINFKNKTSTKEVIGYYSNFYTIFNKSISGIDGMYYNIDNKFYGYKFTDNLLSMTRLGKMYVNTSDADATSDDLIADKIAYANGKKIVGTLPDLGANLITGVERITPNAGFDGSQIEFVSPEITGPVAMLSDKVAITMEPQMSQVAEGIGLTADKIKKNEEILGITGTYEGSSSGGTGDVKLFETEDQMQADKDVQEGDKAVVYREQVQGITEDTEFQICEFPATVTLDTALTDNVYGMFRNVDMSTWFDASVDLSQTSFMFRWYGDSTNGEVTYTSEDGITYTRTDTLGNPIDLGTVIKSEHEWNDLFGKFIFATGYYFGGLFEYRLNVSNKNYVQPIKFPDYIPDNKEEAASMLDTLTQCDYTVSVDNLIKAASYLPSGVNFNDMMTGGFFYNDTGMYFAQTSDEYKDSVVFCAGNKSDTDRSPVACVSYKSSIDLYKIADDFNSVTFIRTVQGTNINGMYVYDDIDCNMFTVCVRASTNKSYPAEIVGSSKGLVLLDYASNKFNDVSNGSKDEWLLEDTYTFASTQLTLKNANELLPGKVALGKHGLVTGDGTIMSNLPVDNVWTDMFNISNNRIDIANSHQHDSMNKLSRNIPANKLFGVKLDSSGSDILYKLINTNNVTNPNAVIGDKWYYVNNDNISLTNVSVTEVDVSTKTVKTYTFTPLTESDSNPYTHYNYIAITENYIGYMIRTGKYQSGTNGYKYNFYKYDMSDGSQVKIGYINSSNTSFKFMAGKGDKLLSVTERSAGGSQIHLVKLHTNTITQITTGGSIMGLPGISCMNNDCAFVPTVYKSAIGSYPSDADEGFVFNFETEQYQWCSGSGTITNVSSWYNTGVLLCDENYMYMGLIDNGKTLIIYDKNTNKILRKDITTAGFTSTYATPIMVHNGKLYFQECCVDCVNFEVSEHINAGITGIANSIIDEDNRFVVTKPLKNGTFAEYISYKVNVDSINVLNQPDAIITSPNEYNNVIAILMENFDKYFIETPMTQEEYNTALNIANEVLGEGE